MLFLNMTTTSKKKKKERIDFIKNDPDYKPKTPDMQKIENYKDLE